MIKYNDYVNSIKTYRMTTDKIETLIERINEGDKEALDDLFPIVYQELRESAHRIRSRFRNQDTLNTTALVHEAYLKLSRADLSSLKDKSHFYHLASKAIRQIMINACDKKATKKRGESTAHLPINDLEESLQFSEKTSDEIQNVDELLKMLEAKQPTYGKIVECRFFAGLNIDETSKVVGMSPSSVKRTWKMAKAWLHVRLAEEDNALA
ncbi:MAG: ECF-type sigma factor [Bacteroidota bacterium]